MWTTIYHFSPFNVISRRENKGGRSRPSRKTHHDGLRAVSLWIWEGGPTNRLGRCFFGRTFILDDPPDVMKHLRHKLIFSHQLQPIGMIWMSSFQGGGGLPKGSQRKGRVKRSQNLEPPPSFCKHFSNAASLLKAAVQKNIWEVCPFDPQSDGAELLVMGWRIGTRP